MSWKSIRNWFTSELALIGWKIGKIAKFVKNYWFAIAVVAFCALQVYYIYMWATYSRSIADIEIACDAIKADIDIKPKQVLFDGPETPRVYKVVCETK